MPNGQWRAWRACTASCSAAQHKTSWSEQRLQETSLPAPLSSLYAGKAESRDSQTRCYCHWNRSGFLLNCACANTYSGSFEKIFIYLLLMLLYRQYDNEKGEQVWISSSGKNFEFFDWLQYEFRLGWKGLAKARDRLTLLLFCGRIRTRQGMLRSEVFTSSSFIHLYKRSSVKKWTHMQNKDKL